MSINTYYPVYTNPVDKTLQSYDVQGRVQDCNVETILEFFQMVSRGSVELFYDGTTLTDCCTTFAERTLAHQLEMDYAKGELRPVYTLHAYTASPCVRNTSVVFSNDPNLKFSTTKGMQSYNMQAAFGCKETKRIRVE